MARGSASLVFSVGLSPPPLAAASRVEYRRAVRLRPPGSVVRLAPIMAPPRGRARGHRFHRTVGRHGASQLSYAPRAPSAASLRANTHLARALRAVATCMAAARAPSRLYLPSLRATSCVTLGLRPSHHLVLFCCARPPTAFARTRVPHGMGRNNTCIPLSHLYHPSRLRRSRLNMGRCGRCDE